MSAIGAAHFDLVKFSCRLDGLQGPQRHLIVIGRHPVDLLAGSQPVFHDRLALLALPVAGLFAGDLDVGELFLDDLLNAIGPAVGGFVAQLTDQDG